MPEVTTPAAPRQSRTTGYHNAIDELSADVEDHGPPPTYTTACRSDSQSIERRRAASAPLREALPKYACSISEAVPVSIKYERTSPFTLAENSQWGDAYIVLQGTRLAIHQQATPGLFSKGSKTIMAGKLVKSYTLQHAEVGVASDCKKYELVSRTPMTAFLPLAIQEKMKETEPHLFEPIRQYIIRLRVECDQLLIRVGSWDQRADWIEKLCAAIDIAPPLEERSEPKNHTLPRRRHRTQQRVTAESARARLQNLVEDQQRIIRERFPHLLLPEAAQAHEQGSELDQDAGDNAGDPDDPDADDLDTSIVRGEQQPDDDHEDQDDLSSMMQRLHRFVQPAHPPHPQGRLFTTPEPRNRPRLHPISGGPLVRSTPPRPRTPRTTREPPTPQDPSKPAHTPQMDFTQDARYRRRCMPSLLINSRRATDIVVSNGSRYKLDWAASTMKPYPEQPPSYTAILRKTDSQPTDENALPTVNSLAPDRPPLRNSRSATTVDGSAGSSLEEITSPNARRTLKGAVGSWGKKIRLKRRETDGSTSAQADVSIMEEKMQGPAIRERSNGEA